MDDAELDGEGGSMDVPSPDPVEFVCDDTMVDAVAVVVVGLELEDEETRVGEEFWLGD